MNSQDSVPVREHGGDADTIDLQALVQAVWGRRWLVLAIVVLGVAAGIAFSVYNTRYVSSGLLLTPHSALAQFKRWEDALRNEPRLEAFLRGSGKQNQPVADQLRGLVREPASIQDAVQPEFSFTDRDAKQFGVKVEGPGELIGVNLVLKLKQRVEEAPVLALAEYVRDTAIRVDLQTFILDKCLEGGVKQQQLRIEHLQGEFKIAQLEARAARLREIVRGSPKAETEVRQVVSVDNGGDKFLPPATQLATTEIAVADANLEDAKRERERLAAEIRGAYYCEARKLVESEISGRELLGKLPELRKQALLGKDESVGVVDQTSSEIALQYREWSDRYLEQMRFVASPEGAQSLERRPGRALGAILGLLFGSFVGISLAVTLAWWRRHRDNIVSNSR
jgi:LPS O-antigen subunit length determinant protein (WzzB/FepE family)